VLQLHDLYTMNRRRLMELGQFATTPTCPIRISLYTTTSLPKSAVGQQDREVQRFVLHYCPTPDSLDWVRNRA
jgi:hypothetical protein